jgi:hypothetical protein
VRLVYPLAERTEEKRAGDERVTVRWRGGTVVGVTPRGPGLDTYARRQVAPARSIPQPEYPVNSRVDW